MTNEFGEYLNYKIRNANTDQERAYYEALRAMNENEQPKNYYEYTPVVTNNAYVPTPRPQDNNYNYRDIQPTTVGNDKALQQDIEDGSGAPLQDDTRLNIYGEPWDGMESGYTERDSMQPHIWEQTFPARYRKKAAKWANNQGILEITPRQQRQKYTYSTIAYISKNQNEPKTQRFPISDVTVVPHQINFDFYDTTEGRIGVSHATEKHMSVEFDVYLTDYIFYGWNIGDNNTNQYYLNVPDQVKRNIWQSIHDKTYTDRRFIEEIEQTTQFTTFRNTFLQQRLGWICDFNSHVFGKFTGVINDVSFQINSGESFAKWHIKIEEALFIDGWYETKGQKPETTTSEDASTTDSGSATDVENIDIAQ